jgi:hypothetical protein
MTQDAWYPLIVLAPVAGLASYGGAQVLIARLGRHRNPYRSLTLGFLAGLAVLLACTWYALAGGRYSALDAGGLLILNVLIYLALAFGYFNFVNLGIASLRIRMLAELVAAGGQLPAARLLARYNSEAVAAVRIERLLAGGHLTDIDGHLRIGRRRFLLVARIFDGLRALILGSRTATGRQPHPRGPREQVTP